MAAEKFADKNLHEYTRELASAEGKPGGGSAIALAGALASSLGLMVAGLTDGKPKYAQYEEDIKKCLKDLETLRVYLVHLVDEDIKAFEPLAKYAPMDKSDPEIKSHYQASLRLACAIPTEVMYKMTELVGYLSKLAEEGSAGAVSDVGVALCLCRAVMEGARFTCLANAKYFDDEVYAMTVTREFEIVFKDNMPAIDAAIAKVEERLKR
jgi:formiminotetrahydrofolate cyclodeaminase